MVRGIHGSAHSAPKSTTNTSITAGGNVTYQVTNNFGGSGSIFGEGGHKSHHKSHSSHRNHRSTFNDIYDDFRPRHHKHHHNREFGGYPEGPMFMMAPNQGSSGPSFGSVLGNTAKGAAMGAAVGSIVPGVGTAAGAVIGGGVSLVKSVFSGW